MARLQINVDEVVKHPTATFLWSGVEFICGVHGTITHSS